MIDLSIIIINYNTFDLTCKCVESVFRFTRDINFEVIIVDNASTERDVADFKQRFPEIILMKNEVNTGFAKGNNAGLQVAKGGTILLLNSDTEVFDNVIGELYQRLHTTPGVGVVTCKLVFPDGKVQHQCGRFPSIGLQLLELFRIQKLMPKRTRENVLLGGFFDHNRLMYPDWVWGTFFMFKGEVLNCFSDRKLPDTYFMYQEDLEWCYLIQQCGYKILYDPTYHILHYFSGSSTERKQVARKNEMLLKHLKDFLIRFRGRQYATIFFGLQSINTFLQRNQK